MNRYEISLWEDFQDISNGVPFLNERKLCTIGDNKMTSWIRAREPKMVENINGTHTFTFKVFSFYIDEITGEQKTNPFKPYLINERKVKVFWQDNWYDLIIKNIDEDSSDNSAVYTCKDVFITELSKNGYNIELTSDLQNNSGTASELAEQVLSGSGWRFDTEQSDKIYQYLEQPVYESVISGSGALEVSLVSPIDSSETISIPLSAKVLILKSSLDGIQEGVTESREVHIIYTEDFQTEQNEMLVVNGQEYQFTGNVTHNSNDTFTIIKGNSRIEYLQLSTRYRAKGLVKSQKSAYDPLFERYVNIYTDNNGNKIYGFQTTEFSKPITVVNLIANSSNFRNTDGWIGQGIDWMVYPNDWENMDISTYNTIGYLKIPVGSFYNNGISANLNLLQPSTSEIKNGDIGGFQVGDKFIFRAKIKNNLSNNSYVKTGFNFQVCEFNLDYTKKGNSYFSSTIINPNSDWYEAILTCTKSCPATELNKLGFFFTNNSNSVLYIEDIQFFKDVQGADDIINYYAKSQSGLVININEANGNTYSFYKDSEKKILIDLKGIPDRYTVEPGTGNGSEYWPLDKSIRLKPNQSGTTTYDVINMSDNIISTFTVEVFNQTYDPDYIEIVKTYIAPGELYLQGVSSVVYKYYNANQEKGIRPEEVEFLYIGEEESSSFTPVYTYEKITTIEAKGSNRFNILQSIAESFQCWVRFNIDHESNGKISLDSNGLPKKYVTLVNNVGTDLGWSFIYGIDLKTIKRKIISEDIVTKTIVLDNNNEFGKNGFCSIARSQLNYPKENFILNFDYYIKAGLLDKEEVNADLYYTSNGHMGYLQRLSDWNNQYIESVDVLVQKKLELDKQTSELEVLSNDNKAKLEKITSMESDLIKIAGVSTLEEAKQYVDSHATDDKVNSLMPAIGQLRKEQSELVGQITLLEESVENLKDYINKQDAAQRAIISTIKNLHEEFFKKYSRYIQEGTWQSEDYIDDDKYYLDAMEVAHTSAFPKVQYDINVIRVNSLEEFSSKKFNVGDICYIQDKDFFNFVTDDGNPYKLQIVISEITSYFDSPEKDVIKVQNYKTQFEDLFQRITATTQSLQYSEGSYEKAAGVLNPNGTLKFDLLQQTFDNNTSILMNASNQNVTWDDTGITIKDSTNSAQLLRIMSGGLFVSNNGGLTWKNAVRGDGISTDVLTAGRINTGEIFILNDDYPTFRWDSNGITAYSWDNNGVHFNKFVRYDQYGLYGYEGLADFVPNNINDVINNATFGLTWNGFFMKATDGSGSVIINSNDNNVIKCVDGNNNTTFSLNKNGSANFTGVVHATSLFLDSDAAKKTITDLIPEEQDLSEYLKTSELNGEVSSLGYITLGRLNDEKTSWGYITSDALNGYICVNQEISGTNTYFIVESNGALTARNAIISGTVYATNGSFSGEVVASSGDIGGWHIAVGEKETWPARNIDNNTIIGTDTMKPNRTYTYIVRIKNPSSTTNKWYSKNAENRSVWLDGEGTLTTPSDVTLTYKSYELNTNYRAIDLKYTTFSSNKTFVLAFSFSNEDATSKNIKVRKTSEEADTENGIPATEGFSAKKDYWNRFVPEGALYAPDYQSESNVAGKSGELFGWYPNNNFPSGTGSDASTDEKFEMVPWRGIYLSPINNDKAYIKIPGSTATDGSNLKDDWRIIIGNNFGVDSTGTVYASNLHLTGNITWDNNNPVTKKAVFGVFDTSSATQDGIYNNNGTLYIKASNISAGILNAGEIQFQAYQTSSDKGGGFKCAQGKNTSEDSNTTYGAMMYGGKEGINYFIATDGGVRMTAGVDSNSPSEVFCVSKEVRINSTNVYVNGQSFVTNTGAFTGSDRNKKHNISYDFEKYEDFYKSLKPSYFKLNDGTSNRYHIGFIAQDVESALLNNNLTTQDFAGFGIIRSDNKPEYQALRYEEFISLNTYMIQKLMKQIEDLQQEIENLKQ